MLAVRATERLRDRARKGLGAFRAKRRGDPRRARPAIRAEIFAPRDSSRADYAGCRVKERAQGEQWISVRELQHASTILSSKPSSEGRHRAAQCRHTNFSPAMAKPAFRVARPCSTRRWR